LFFNTVPPFSNGNITWHNCGAQPYLWTALAQGEWAGFQRRTSAFKHDNRVDGADATRRLKKILKEPLSISIFFNQWTQKILYG